MSDDRALRRLADEFSRVHERAKAGRNATSWWDWAEVIERDPQAHIDALVDAGVLRRHSVEGEQIGYHGSPSEAWTERPVYEVVQPHVHEWRVDLAAPERQKVHAVCACGALRALPNLLPIEVPE